MSVPEDTFVPASEQGQTPETSQAPAPADDSKTQQQEPQAKDGQQGEAETDEQRQERDERGRYKGLQPRIDELTRKRHEAEREAAYWRGVATQGKAPQSADQHSAAPAAPTKPTPDQFEDYASFVEALADFKADQKVAQAMSQQQAAAARQQQASTWEQRQAAARTAMPDYDAVVGATDAPVAAHVAEALVESEHGPALAYHLAKHPEVLARLNSLPQRQADRELGRIEATLSAPADVPADHPARTTQAPKPAAVNLSQGRSVADEPSKMSIDDYVAHRSKGPNKARWAR
jgi:hypothetical protein